MKKLSIIGNVGMDAQIREFNGNQFLQFTVAVNERFKNADGTHVERTDWINCSSHRLGLAPYITRGKKIYCEGSPTVKTYQSRDGEWKSSFNLHVKFVELLSPNDKRTNEE